MIGESLALDYIKNQTVNGNRVYSKAFTLRPGNGTQGVDIVAYNEVTKKWDVFEVKGTKTSTPRPLSPDQKDLGPQDYATDRIERALGGAKKGNYKDPQFVDLETATSRPMTAADKVLARDVIKDIGSGHKIDVTDIVIGDPKMGAVSTGNVRPKAWTK